MIEIWKSIKGLEGLYQISNFGNVFSFRSDNLLNPNYDKLGYSRVTLYKNRKIFLRISIHRLVAMHFLDLPENYKELVVNHKDCNPKNNNFNNLEWTTIQGNTKHAYKNGKAKGPKGEKNGMSKLTEINVIKIIDLWNTKEYNQKEISQILNVSRSAVSHITQGNNWKHLQHLNKRKTKWSIK